MKAVIQSLFITGTIGLLLPTGRLVSHEAVIPELFRSVVLPEPASTSEGGLPILRTARIQLDPDLFDPRHPSAITPGSRWVVNLFNEESVVFQADHVTTPRAASLTTTGTIDGHSGSLVVIASVDNAVNGIITIPKLGRFQIEYTKHQEQRLNEIDPAATPTCGAGSLDHETDHPEASHPIAPTTIHSTSGLQKHWSTRRPSPAPTIINALFLYTPSTLEGAGGESGVLSLIDLAIAEANAVFRNSQLNVVVNLAHTQRTDYQDSGSIETDYGNLGNARGRLSNVGSLRRQYGADLVSLIAETDSRGWSGVGRILNNSNGNANHYHTVMTRRWIAAGFYLYVHEIAHNLGCQHDRLNAKTTDGTIFEGAFPHSLGYRFKTDEITHITVMAYDPGIPLPFFSDPKQKYDGVALGREAGHEDEADNVSTIKHTAPLVAAYRENTSWHEFSESNIQATESDSDLELTIVRFGDLSRRSTVRLISKNGTAKQRADFESISARLEFEPGMESITVPFTLVNDDVPEEQETFKVVLGTPTGSAGTLSPASIEVSIVDDEWPFYFEQTNVIAHESDKGVEVIVRVRENASIEPEQSLTYQVVSNRTAETNPVISGQIRFTEPTVPGIIRIPISDDITPEPDEILTVRIGPSSSMITILDDDRSGSIDAEFSSLVAAPEGVTWGLTFQDANHFLIAGDFNQVAGEPRAALARIKLNGQLSENFAPANIKAQRIDTAAAYRPAVNIRAVLQNGKILIGGSFAEIDGKVQTNFARYHADGSLDETFRPSVDGGVSEAIELPNGRILISGSFEHVDGQSQKFLARLLPDGSLDPTFDLGKGIDGFPAWVGALAVQTDGKILIGGRFDTVDDVKRVNIARLHPNGAVDHDFITPRGADGPVNEIYTLPDGRSYIIGKFTRLSGRLSQKIGRLLPDGSLDPDFQVSRSLQRNLVQALPLPDGRIFVVGEFVEYGSTPRGRIALLKNDGSLDESFDPGSGADDVITSLAIHGNGWVYVSGLFQHFNGVPSPHIARLRTQRFRPEIVSIWNDKPNATIQLSGFHGTKFRLESSHDLNQWLPGEEQTVSSTDLQISVPLNHDQPAGFFRVEP